MLTWIFSILWWCLPDKKGIGITALILSALGILFDGLYYGPLAIIDIIVFIVNLVLLIRRK